MCPEILVFPFVNDQFDAMDDQKIALSIGNAFVGQASICAVVCQ